jgi:hypothetical protein
VRVIVGALLFWHALGAARDLAVAGYFGDFFHMPLVPAALVPSRTVYVVSLGVRLLLAVLVVVGHRARGALLVSAVLGLWVLLANRLEFHHNRYALYLYALLLSLTPCDRSHLLLDGADEPAEERTGPFWAVLVAQVQVALVYLASGGSKLLDADWRDGLVLADRIHRYAHVAIHHGVPSGVVGLLGRADVSSALAKLAIMTELLVAVGLFIRRARVYALWWGVWFHLLIQLTSEVEVFTWLAIAVYGFFVTPDFRARRFFFDPTRAKSRAWARAVRALDWLARFEVKAWDPDDIKRGHSVVIVRRDGTRATGIRAVAMTARCIPLLFPIWAPLALAASFTKGGEASSGS